MNEINVVLKALPKDKVNVKNYKSKYGAWESGEVMDVETHFRSSSHHYNVYRVMLDRKSEKGNYLFLYVGDDKIELFQKEK